MPAQDTSKIPKTASTPLLEAKDLSQSYNQQEVISGLNLELHAGDVFGLVGVNGAGKSTLLHMLAGLLAPTSGQIRVNDNVSSALGGIGYLADPPALHDCLTVRESVHTSALLHGISRDACDSYVDAAIERCNLSSVSAKRVKALSKGFKQRTGLAAAIVHNPALLILDEPASGLDPVQSEHLNQVITELSADRAIVFSSHALADVQSCCTRVGVLHEGNLITPEYDDQSPTRCYRLRLRNAVTAEDLLALPQVSSADAVDKNIWQITLEEPQPESLAAAIVERGWGLQGLTEAHHSEQDIMDQLHRRQEHS